MYTLHLLSSRVFCLQEIKLKISLEFDNSIEKIAQQP